MDSATSLPRKVIRATVTAVEDQRATNLSPNIVVWVRAEHADPDSEPTHVSFHTAGDNAPSDADIGLADRAKSLEPGQEVVIEYVTLSGSGGDINLGRGLSVS